MSCTFSISSTGIGAAPELRSPSRRSRFSAAALGWLMSAVISVGTVGKKKIFSKLPMIPRSSSISKRGTRIWVAQLKKAQFMQTMLP